MVHAGVSGSLDALSDQEAATWQKMERAGGNILLSVMPNNIALQNETTFLATIKEYGDLTAQQGGLFSKPFVFEELL